ncbi:hypothetical protein BCON_0136g00130 [Botryotinia convoluta]|uniref:Uncharacterized protein n=1 Tax=Botryotinia convoluta TaxID=54673 RepID=A0A4Z1HU89_9HELO|nr:hypothetical protein BCON_0136g00130 [Botryotinia convoluta]
MFIVWNFPIFRIIVVDARPDARAGTDSDGLVVGDCLLNHHGYLGSVGGERTARTDCDVINIMQEESGVRDRRSEG